MRAVRQRLTGSPLGRHNRLTDGGGASTLRYALVGAGSAARVHLREIARQPGVALVGVADPADPRSWAAAVDHGDCLNVPRFADAAALVNEVQPDLVSICTPNKFHCEATLSALRAGAHVACEKPMAMTVKEAERMEAARAAVRAFGGINFSHRNLAAFRFARELIARGDLGPVDRANVVYFQSFRASPDARWSWRSDASLAGFGALGDLGVHMIDAVRFVTGREFRRVVGIAQTLGPGRDGSDVARCVTTDTRAAFLAELVGGALATFETSQTVLGYGDFFRLEISGSTGTLIANSERPEEIGLHRGPPAPGEKWRTHIPVQELPAAFPSRGLPTSPGAIVHAIRGEAATFPNFADGLAAQRVLAAIRESTRTGRWIDLD